MKRESSKIWDLDNSTQFPKNDTASPNNFSRETLMAFIQLTGKKGKP